MVEGKASTNLLRGLLFLSPAIFLLAIFTFYPLVNTFVISLKENYNYMNDTFTAWSLSNYIKVFTNSDYPYYLINTILIVFITVPISIILSLIISVALHSVKHLQKFFQTVFFLPYVTNTIAIGMVFSIMFESYNQGLVNTVLRVLGSERAINWLGGNRDGMVLGKEFFSSGFFASFAGGTFFTPQWFTSMIVLMVYIIWNSLPFKILILLSGLQSIDKQYYQAAQIDGTSKFRTLTRITAPLLSPQIIYLMITSFIGAFKEYNSIVAIIGPTATPYGYQSPIMGTVVWYLYQNIKGGKDGFGMGYAAAGSLLLFIIIMIITAINSRISKKFVHY